MADYKSQMPMWQMFYTPITVVFDDLENNVGILEHLITTFLTYETSFANTYTPKCDGDEQGFEDNFSFTLWFQGSLFYLIGCPSLET